MMVLIDINSNKIATDETISKITEFAEKHLLIGSAYTWYLRNSVKVPGNYASNYILTYNDPQLVDLMNLIEHGTGLEKAMIIETIFIRVFNQRYPDGLYDIKIVVRYLLSNPLFRQHIRELNKFSITKRQKYLCKALQDDQYIEISENFDVTELATTIWELYDKGDFVPIESWLLPHFLDEEYELKNKIKECIIGFRTIIDSDSDLKKIFKGVDDIKTIQTILSGMN